MTGEKYYIHARGNTMHGPMTMDEAREKAAKLAFSDSIKGVKILAHVDTVASSDGKEKNEQFRQWLPDNSQGNPPDHAGPPEGKGPNRGDNE